MNTYIRFFKIASLLLFLLLAAVQFTLAQESESSTTDLAKSWSLQFQINNNFQLSSFQGSTISAKYHLSSKHAMRFGISLSGNIQDQELDRMRMGVQENKLDRLSLQVRSHYLFYFPSIKKTQLYFGVGPTLEYLNNDTKTLESLSKRTRESYLWGVGISGVLGIEWLVRENIGLLAEYGTSFLYNYSKSEDVYKQTVPGNDEYEIMDRTEQEMKAFSINSLSIKFGLSVYF